MKRKHRKTKLLAMALLLLPLTSCPSFLIAAEPATVPAPQVGEKVWVPWAGKSVEAEVVSLQPGGWVKVKFQANGREINPVFPPNQVTRQKAGGGEGHEPSKEEKDEATLRANPGNRNVSGKSYEDWHAPGSAGTRQGALLGHFRVAAYRAGSSVVIFSNRDGKETVLPLEAISNADRARVFEVLKKP